MAELNLAGSDGTQSTQLTEAERLDWLSEKYGPRTTIVYALESGRFVVAERGYSILHICEADEVVPLLRRVATNPPPVYQPPTERIIAPPADLAELVSNLKLRI